MAKDKLISIEIVTPQRTIFAGKAESITVPGTKAPFQVLFNHAPIVSSLELGVIKIVDENSKPIFFASTKGFIEVNKNMVSVLVDTAEEASSINRDNVLSELKELKTKATGVSRQETDELNYKIKILENKLKLKSKS